VTKYFFDTEFMEDGEVIELLSLGLVSEDGREFYAEDAEADWSHANAWVQANVLPHLAGPGPYWMTRKEIVAELVAFVRGGGGTPEFWAYYGDYDWVVLCQLFGRMVDLPEGWPMFAMDVKQLAVTLGNPRLPEQTSVAHNALTDARWTRDAWRFLVAYEKDRYKAQ
jgi:hypothetical protein